MNVINVLMVVLLVFGFGFVIFWHELGHFLAAKWAGVKVDQFAVGFGQAAISWRKGLGFRIGSSAAEYEQRLRAHLEGKDSAGWKSNNELNLHSREAELAGDALGLGETEYRLNWIPLGGYVKMVGQDDLDPAARSDSPRAYNNRPVWKRMIIVSAGVVMNMILAVILFTALFGLTGFNVPPALVGGVVPGSPAQLAGLRAGDRVLSINGSETHDFNKMMMTVALLQADASVPMTIKGVDGQIRTITITPAHMPSDPSFLKLGIEPASELRGLDPKTLPSDWAEEKKQARPELFAIEPGDTITAVNGHLVTPKEFSVLEDAIQDGGGKPIELTVQPAKGAEKKITVQPMFEEPFSGNSLSFAGLAPQGMIESVASKSAAEGKLKPGDVVTAVSSSATPTNWQPGPSPKALVKVIGQLSEDKQYANFKVIRDGNAVEVHDVATQTQLKNGNLGLGISIGYDLQHPTIGEVIEGSPAARAGVPTGATINSVNRKDIHNWYDIYNVLREIGDPKSVPVELTTKDGPRTVDLQLDAADLTELASHRFMVPLALHPYEEIRKTANPIEAAKWGVAETRDLTLQFYLMLRRMFQGSVSPKNAMGPYGIFKYGSAFAQRGVDWLIWFLAMISANLAVVNFLPIPIVDGGLFVFLLLEKLMGRPLSPRAQGIAQIVGLCLIGTVFLFVTYNDIRR